MFYMVWVGRHQELASISITTKTTQLQPPNEVTRLTPNVSVVAESPLLRLEFKFKP